MVTCGFVKGVFHNNEQAGQHGHPSEGHRAGGWHRAGGCPCALVQYHPAVLQLWSSQLKVHEEEPERLWWLEGMGRL